MIDLDPNGTVSQPFDVNNNGQVVGISQVNLETHATLWQVPLVTHVGPPTSKNQCKNGGWQAFDTPRHFKNQGDCIQFVNTGK